MSRVNGKAPPVFVRDFKPAMIKDCWQAMRASDIPVGTRVVVRLKAGQRLSGKLTNQCDWLVGCPIVEGSNGEAIGIGYDGDIIEVIAGQGESA